MTSHSHSLVMNFILTHFELCLIFCILIPSVRLLSLPNSDLVLNSDYCALLTVQEPGDAFTDFQLPSNQKSLNLTRWLEFSKNSTVVKIKVRDDCLFRVCFLHKKISYVYQYCENIGEGWDHDQVYSNKLDLWKGQYNTTTGLACSCERSKTCSESCSNPVFSPTDKKVCAKLYVEKDCFDCNFPERELKVGQPFTSQGNDSLTIFSSLVVRENCTVTSNVTERDLGTYHLTYRPFIEYNNTIRFQHGHKYFDCNCTDGNFEPLESSSNSNSSDNNNNTVLLIIIGLSVVCVSLLIVIGLMVGFRIWNHTKHFQKLKEVVKHKVTIIPREDIDINSKKLLGSGAFGRVYEGIHKQTGAKVAVKQIHAHHVTTEYLGTLTTEIELLSAIGSHPNVIKMIGACIAELESEVLLVMELCENRSLDKFLKENKEHFVANFTRLSSSRTLSPNSRGYVHLGFNEDQLEDQFETSLDVQQRLERLESLGYTIEIIRDSDLLERIAADVVSGMEYVHSLNILHLDLSLRNILLDNNFTAKVADFGISTQLRENSSYYYKSPDKHLLPLCSMAPEGLETLQFSKKSDIWAMGILLWELYTLGETPYQGPEDQGPPDQLTIKFRIKNGYRLHKPEYCTDEIYAIMRQCWNNDPTLRPDFSQLKALLETEITNL